MSRTSSQKQLRVATNRAKSKQQDGKSGPAYLSPDWPSRAIATPPSQQLPGCSNGPITKRHASHGGEAFPFPFPIPGEKASFCREVGPNTKQRQRRPMEKRDNSQTQKSGRRIRVALLLLLLQFSVLASPSRAVAVLSCFCIRCNPVICQSWFVVSVDMHKMCTPGATKKTEWRVHTSIHFCFKCVQQRATHFPV
jgi:hypothetical protein